MFTFLFLFIFIFMYVCTGTAFLLGSDDCVRGMENGVANVASEYGRRDGYVYSFGYSDCSSIPI